MAIHLDEESQRAYEALCREEAELESILRRGEGNGRAVHTALHTYLASSSLLPTSAYLAAKAQLTEANTALHAFLYPFCTSLSPAASPSPSVQELLPNTSALSAGTQETLGWPAGLHRLFVNAVRRVQKDALGSPECIPEEILKTMRGEAERASEWGEGPLLGNAAASAARSGCMLLTLEEVSAHWRLYNMHQRLVKRQSDCEGAYMRAEEAMARQALVAVKEQRSNLCQRLQAEAAERERREKVYHEKQKEKVEAWKHQKRVEAAVKEKLNRAEAAERPTPTAALSASHRLQELIEAGRRKFEQRQKFYQEKEAKKKSAVALRAWARLGPTAGAPSRTEADGGVRRGEKAIETPQPRSAQSQRYAVAGRTATVPPRTTPAGGVSASPLPRKLPPPQLIQGAPKSHAVCAGSTPRYLDPTSSSAYRWALRAYPGASEDCTDEVVKRMVSTNRKANRESREIE